MEAHPLDFGWWICSFDNGAGSSNLPALESSSSSESLATFRAQNPYDPSVTGEGTSAGGPRPLEIEQEIDQEDIWRTLAAQESAAREDARIYNAVDAINSRCQSEESRIVAKAHAILLKLNVVLNDQEKEDVARAVNIALYDAWEGNIDTRLEQFRRIRRYLGTRNCSIWNESMHWFP